jgi:hypothetical protein
MIGRASGTPVHFTSDFTSTSAGHSHVRGTAHQLLTALDLKPLIDDAGVLLAGAGASRAGTVRVTA